MRIVIILGVLALLNLYAGARIIALWPWAAQHLVTAWIVVALFFALQLVGPFGDHILFPALRKKPGTDGLIAALDWASYLAFGVMSLMVMYGFCLDVTRLLWALLVRPDNLIDFDRRALLTFGVATAGTAALGVWQATDGPKVKRVEIRLRNLPASFDGFRIVQISDLHVGPTIRHDYVANTVKIANGLKPDLIALTGDFADGHVRDLEYDMAPLKNLAATHGLYYITGNHEYYWDADGWMNYFKSIGAHVLLNQHEIIRKGEGAIVLAGVPDYSTRHMASVEQIDPAKALQGAPEGLTRILLAHQPVTYEMAEAAGYDLMLSGHTHAGQYFPFSLLIRFFQRYYKGLNRYKNLQIYVNTATGYWGPPLRALVPTEITEIVLRPAASSL